MLFYLQLTITSKNKKTLLIFANFLKKFLKNSFKKIKFNKTLTVKTTLLKSPHVHKTAQEHFQYKNYKKTILLRYLNLFQITIFLKKLSTCIFYDAKIKTHYFSQPKITILNLKNFYFNLKKHYFYKKTKIYFFFNVLNFNGLILLNLVFV